jgi:hypothetical protein
MWSFTDDSVINGHWKDVMEMPKKPDISGMMIWRTASLVNVTE